MPVRFQVFPRSQRPDDLVLAVRDVFAMQAAIIGTPPNKPDSETVLTAVRPGLAGLGFLVEAGKKKAEQIEIPVLYGIDGVPEKRFFVDAWHPERRAIIEVEAGIAFDARKFYQDLFEAVAMPEVDWACIAVQNAYHPGRFQNGRDDFALALNAVDSLLVSKRLVLPLQTLMVLGY